MAVGPLRALVGAGHDVALVVTRPDRRRGRGSATTPSPVKAAALEAGLEVSHRIEDVLETGAELGVVVAFGRLVPATVLAGMPLVNLHFSLLPRWRGAAPVERAILAGDTETGVCLMGLDAGLDTGPVHGCQRVEVGPEETAAELRDRLAELGTALLVERLVEGVASLGPAHPQVGEPTHAAKLGPEDLHLDWSRSAAELDRVVRVGRAWSTFRGRRFLVLAARVAPAPTGPGSLGALVPGSLGAPDGLTVAAGKGGLELVQVQPEGRGPMAALDWRRGARLQPGEVLGT